MKEFLRLKLFADRLQEIRDHYLTEEDSVEIAKSEIDKLSKEQSEYQWIQAALFDTDEEFRGEALQSFMEVFDWLTYHNVEKTTGDEALLERYEFPEDSQDPACSRLKLNRLLISQELCDGFGAFAEVVRLMLENEDLKDAQGR